jgi:hypothetical protein
METESIDNIRKAFSQSQGGLNDKENSLKTENKEIRETNLRLAERLKDLERKLLIQNHALTVHIT